MTFKCKARGHFAVKVMVEVRDAMSLMFIIQPWGARIVIPVADAIFLHIVL